MEKKYFYGNPVSEYGMAYGRVDYACLARAFDAVLNNEIVRATQDMGYEWEPVGASEEYYEDRSGDVYTYEEAQDRIAELEEERDAAQEALDEAQDMLDKAVGEDADQDDIDAAHNEVEDCEARLDEIQDDLDRLEDAHYYDVYQWYIVSDNAVQLLQEAHEIVYYNEDLDMYVWGVTHWGTSWDYVLTSIKIDW